MNTTPALVVGTILTHAKSGKSRIIMWPVTGDSVATCNMSDGKRFGPVLHNDLDQFVETR